MKRAYVPFSVVSIVSCLSLASPAFAQSGACCGVGSGGNFCSVTGPSSCVLGVYQGDGTSCDTAACLGSPRGACCNIDNNLCVLVDGGLAACDSFWALTSIYHGDGTTCVKTPGGMYDDCPQPPPPPPPGGVPTVSQWGIAIMALLLLIGGKVYFSRRRATQA